MHKLRTLITSANYLFAFEAAARRLNFTEAASELNVTQPAVSKTIRSLEDACGFDLFRRDHSRLSLTPQGEKLFKETQATLDHLHDVITTLRDERYTGTVRASFSTGFVTMWLLPRLSRFKEAWPQITLRIEESNRDTFDLEREDVDISGRLGYGDWPNLNAYPFLREEVVAVCSPEYLRRHGPIETPDDLLKHQLLHFEEKHRKRVDWGTWLSENGVVAKRIPRDIVFTDFIASTQAAILGQGIALGWTSVLADHLSTGQLVAPLGAGLKTDKIMYLVTPAQRPMSEETRIFRDWLLEEVLRTVPSLVP